MALVNPGGTVGPVTTTPSLLAASAAKDRHDIARQKRRSMTMSLMFPLCIHFLWVTALSST